MFDMEKVKHFWNNLFGSYAKGEINGYNLGYDVAKEEFTAKYDIEINIYDDFKNFKEKLNEEYGIDYVQKTEQFFAQFANLREPLLAYSIAHLNHAKFIKSFQDENYRIIYLIKMLAKIYLGMDDIESIGKSKSYTKLGLNLLDENEPYYDSLLRIFTAFKKKVMEKEWETN